MPQEIADLFEGRILGQIVDVVAAVRQHTARAVEIANRQRCDNDVLETCFYRCFAGGHCLDDSSDRRSSMVESSIADRPLRIGPGLQDSYDSRTLDSGLWTLD